MATSPEDSVAAGQSWLLLGYASTRAGDLAGACNAFERALESGVLEREAVQDVRFNLAQLFIVRGQYRLGLEHLERWFADESRPPLAAHELAASAYLGSGRCGPARRHLDVLGRTAGETAARWHEAQALCEADRLGAVGRSDLKVIESHPDEAPYWRRAIAARLARGATLEAIALTEIARQRSLLAAEDSVRLARAYVAAGMPYEGAVLLEQELSHGALARQRSNLELLANAWYAAHENEQATRILTELVRRWPDGNLYHRLGRLAFEREDWAATMDAMRGALAQPVLRDIAGTHLLLGIAACRLGDAVTAVPALQMAARDDATRDAALWWLSYGLRRK